MSGPAATAEIRAINCAGCGASLELLGGYRARGLACRYCGAVMDGHDGYRLVVQHRGLARPDTPVALGARGAIKGVEFTVIGTIEWRSGEDRWVDHQLFSPTHGYCWLTWDDGHLVFGRRTRDVPVPAGPAGLAPKREVRLGDRAYRVFETYDARITFVEGELTWVAKVGDAARATEAIAPPYSLAYEQAGDEWEYGLGEYLDQAEARRAFGLPPARAPRSLHPLKPFVPHPLLRALELPGWVFMGVAALALLATTVLGHGRILLREMVAAPGAEVGPFAFDVTSPGQLLRLDLSSPVRNDWVFCDVRVLADDDDREILNAGGEIGFYEGREDGEYWSEGSTDQAFFFKVPEAGRYVLELELETEPGHRAPPLTVSLREGVLVVRYFVALLLLALAAAGALPAARAQAEQRRWAEADGGDD